MDKFGWSDGDVVILDPITKGGAGSGNFGHSGRLGEVGGSVGWSNGQTLYHGTTQYRAIRAHGFSLDTGSSPLSSGGSMYGKGIYFGLDRDLAREYVYPGASIVEAHLNLEHPAEMDLNTKEGSALWDKVYEKAKDIYSERTGSGRYTPSPRDIAEAFRQSGYDGAHITEKPEVHLRGTREEYTVPGQEMVVVFDTSKITVHQPPVKKGGAGSGDFGHAGRMGERGGSGLSLQERLAVRDYAGKGFHFVNRQLRDGQKLLASVDDSIRQIDAVMAKHTVPAMTVYRGIDAPNLTSKLVVGSQFRDKAYASTSSREIVARDFSDGDAVLRIAVPAGTHGLDMDKLGLSKEGGDETENEVILDRNIRMEVTEINPFPGIPGMKMIDVRVVK